MVALQVAFLALAAGGGDATLLDFYADWCGPCKRMDSTVQQLAEAGYPVQKVNIDQNRKLASKHRVQAIPCFVLTVNGEEVDRLEGPCTINELKRMFEKARPGTPASTASHARTLPGPGASSSELLTIRRNPRPANHQAPTDAEAPPADLVQKLMAASVRLKIDDATGHSFGSGTIIDARDGEALILTCGHVFRDSKGKGPITVDLFGPGAPQGLQGELIDYDLKSDVGLVAIRTTEAISAIPVAPPGHSVQSGDTVISIGCNNGNSPTARQSQVTGLNKFLGPANLQVAGQPVTGRSGGGLFDSKGYLIGVCNAADPTDNEGLYAALPSIHAELDRAKLGDIYREPQGILAAAPVPRDRLAATSAPRDPFAAATGDRGEEPRGIVRPSTAGAARGKAGLSSEEQAVLSELQSRGSGAEVICIIRPLDDPRAQSEIIVLDKASPDFLQRLAGERTAQDARHLTAHEVPRKSVPAKAAGAASGKPHLPAPLRVATPRGFASRSETVR